MIRLRCCPRAGGRWPRRSRCGHLIPGLLRDGDRWIFAYRIVAADGLRRIAICRLDQKLRVIEGSPLPLTDHVQFRPEAVLPEVATRWFADPRLYRLGGRLFVYWNSGWHEPRNCQFVQELDPATFGEDQWGIIKQSLRLKTLGPVSRLLVVALWRKA